MRRLPHAVVVGLLTSVLAALVPAVAASAAGTVSASLSLSPAGPYEYSQHVQATVTVGGGTAGDTYAVQGNSNSCAWWSGGSGTGSIQVDVQVYCDTPLAMTVSDTTDGSVTPGTTNTVNVQVRALQPPTLTLVTQPPYAAGETITGTVKAVDQFGQPFPKAYIDNASDGCMSNPKVVADANGVITVPMTFTCDDDVTLPVTAVSNDGSVTYQPQFTPKVHVALSPSPQPTLSVSPAGPYHSGDVVTATIHVLDGANHPVQGATWRRPRTPA